MNGWNQNKIKLLLHLFKNIAGYCFCVSVCVIVNNSESDFSREKNKLKQSLVSEEQNPNAEYYMSTAIRTYSF
jgi:hypothetical protein